MAVHELILLLYEIARDKWCSYWEHDPNVEGYTYTPTQRTRYCTDSPYFLLSALRAILPLQRETVDVKAVGQTQVTASQQEREESQS